MLNAHRKDHKNGVYMSQFDVGRARGETPGCRFVIHFNNAGASLPPVCVTESVISHIRREAEIGGYEAEAEVLPQLERTYASAARLLGCDRNEIALCESATRAWDMAFYSLPLAAGDRVLASMSEYSSNYIAMLHCASQTGATIEPIPNDDSGALSIPALEQMIDNRVKLIAVTHVGTNGGLVNPAADVGRLASAAGITYLLDATQSVGQMPIDVKQIGCDMLCATGRKYLRGPRGTGLLYLKREVAETLTPPFLDNFAAEWTSKESYKISPGARRFETWECNCANRIGLGTAIDYALQWGLDAIQQRVVFLAETLRSRLADIPGVAVRDVGKERCGIVTFTVADRSCAEIRAALTANSINVWTSPMMSTRLDMEARGLSELVRASVHYYNSEEEIERFILALISIVG